MEELDVSYEYVSLDLSAEEHRQPDYLAINPIGKVPTIVDGDFAIENYVAQLSERPAFINTIGQR